MQNKTFNWADEVLRTAAQQNHYISASGSSESTSYRLGFGYQSEENVFKKNDYERFNIKGAFDSKLNKVVEAGMSVNLAYDVQDDFTTDGSNAYSPYNNAFWFAPILSPWDENGKLYEVPGKPGNGVSFTSTPNPLIDFILPNAYENQTRKFHVFGSAYLRFNLYDGLKFTTTFSPNFYHGRQGIFFGTGVTDEFPLGSSWFQKKKYNEAKVVNTDRFDWTWDNQVDYNKTWGDHTFGAMGLFSMYASNKETYTMSGRNISDDKLSYHALAKAGTDGKSIASTYTESSLVSVAARLNYSYKGKYMATVTMRADGSSRFAEGNRWGFFPSAAVAWRMSEENFLKSASWLDNLKLRAAYGVTGNNNVNDYVTMSSAAGPNYVVIGGEEFQGYYPNGLIDLGLQWEEIKEFNFGVDFSAFNGRLGLTADVYRRLSDGQIMKATVPVETGETSITTNIGSVRNAGIELGFNFGVLRLQNFTWDLGVNFSRNWSKIKELPNGDDVANNWFLGERLNVLRDYKHTDVVTADGVTMHTKDGDVHYTLKEAYEKFGLYEGTMGVHDWNNDGKISDEDKQIYGCKDPKWMGSITSSMAFYGFDFRLHDLHQAGPVVAFVHPRAVHRLQRPRPSEDRDGLLHPCRHAGSRPRHGRHRHPHRGQTRQIPLPQQLQHLGRRLVRFEGQRQGRRLPVSRHFVREGEEHLPGLHLPEALDAEGPHQAAASLRQRAESFLLDRLRGLRPRMGERYAGQRRSRLGDLPDRRQPEVLIVNEQES